MNLLFLFDKVKKTIKMNKTKLRILKIGIVVCTFLIFLIWSLSYAEAAFVADNVEALTRKEIYLETVCTRAGGLCRMDATAVVNGISFPIDR